LDELQHLLPIVGQPRYQRFRDHPKCMAPDGQLRQAWVRGPALASELHSIGQRSASRSMPTRTPRSVRSPAQSIRSSAIVRT
jgi:hypothetical protein